MKDLNGRFGVVTGAGKGIGRAIAQRLLDENISGLAILDWNGELLEQTAKELDPSGTRVLPLQCNIADAQQVHEVFEQINAHFGRVDILINNAGITRDAIFHKMTPEQIKQVMDVNFFGTYNCINEVVPGMRERSYGKIISLSSTSALGNAGQANYAASKAAIEGLTKTLAKELARKNITVNCIAPALIETDMMMAVPEERMAQYLASLPMQRMGKPEEIASVAAFLSSDDSSYVSGVVLIASGACVIR